MRSCVAGCGLVGVIRGRAGPGPSGRVDDLAVVGEGHVGGKVAVGFFVGQLVGDVREVGALGTDSLGVVDGLLEVEVRGVGALSHGGQDEDVQTFEERPGSPWDLANIRAVGEVADTKAEDGKRAVQQRDGGDSDGRLGIDDRGFVMTSRGSGRDVERPVDRVRGQLRLGRGILGVVLEDVGEHGSEAFERIRQAVAGEVLILHPVEAAKVVEAGEVVDVVVRVKHGIDMADVVGQAL